MPLYTNLLPIASHVLPPSLERWISCPNQPVDCDAYNRFGSTGEAFRWYISQPPKWGPLTCHCSRLPSAVRTNAPFRVPTRTRTPLIPSSFLHAHDHPGVGVRTVCGSARTREDRTAEGSSGRGR